MDLNGFVFLFKLRCLITMVSIGYDINQNKIECTVTERSVNL